MSFLRTCLKNGVNGGQVGTVSESWRGNVTNLVARTSKSAWLGGLGSPPHMLSGRLGSLPHRFGTSRWCWVALLTAILAGGAVSALAGETSTVPQYEFEIRFYQALTNITGNGLTSQTLPGIEGWFQIMHVKLDEVELAMEGPTLTWNGKPAPDYPRILLLSSPKIVTQEGEKASVGIGSENRLQYMVRKDDNLFELHSLDADSEPEVLGVVIRLLPKRAKGAADLLDCDLTFRYTWVKEREKIEGVDLDVGKPVIGRQAAEGSVQLRLGEWSCYRTSVNSEGTIFLFVRAVERPEEAAAVPPQEK